MKANTGGHRNAEPVYLIYGRRNFIEGLVKRDNWQDETRAQSYS